MPYGFHLQNSPAQIDLRDDVDRPMVLLSTSGTRLMCEAATRGAAYAGVPSEHHRAGEGAGRKRTNTCSLRSRYARGVSRRGSARLRLDRGAAGRRGLRARGATDAQRPRAVGRRLASRISPVAEAPPTCATPVRPTTSSSSSSTSTISTEASRSSTPRSRWETRLDRGVDDARPRGHGPDPRRPDIDERVRAWQPGDRAEWRTPGDRRLRPLRAPAAPGVPLALLGRSLRAPRPPGGERRVGRTAGRGR